MQMTSRVPTEIRLNPAKNELSITFNDGTAFQFSAEFLRVHSPSAEVKGHTPQQKKTVGGKKDVTISAINATGNYAVRIVFSDGHDTGLYSWPYFHEIGTEKSRLWDEYLIDLERLGLSRDPFQ